MSNTVVETKLNKPRLRFKDDSGNDFPDWIEQKISEIGQTYNGLTGKSSQDFGDGYPFITYKQIFDSSEINVEKFGKVRIGANEKQNEVNYGDILFTTSSETPEEVGFASVYTNKEIKPYLNSFSFGLRPYTTNKLDAYFSKYLFRNNTYRKIVVKLAQGITRYNISKNAFLKLTLTIPSQQEQQKIADFLMSVDNWIYNLKAQKESLEKYKKGMMQKIFSRKIRFKDDNGNDFPDWENKKLSNFLIERNYTAPKSDQYPLMSFVAYKGVSPKGDRYDREFLVSDSINKKYKQTEYGDFIYSSNNLETGSIGLNCYGSATISPVYSIFQVKESCDYRFIGSYLVRKSFINKMLRYRQGVIYGQWKIHESDFLKISEMIPNIKEQQKIANFLSSIDSQIELKQKQIEKAELWKKGLMQEMFV